MISPRRRLGRSPATLVCLALLAIGALFAAGCTAGSAAPAPVAIANNGWLILHPTAVPNGSVAPTASRTAPAATSAAKPGATTAGTTAGAGAGTTTAAKPAAAKPKPPAAPTAAPAVKLIRVVVASQRFSIGMPATWVAIAVDGKAASSGVQRIASLTSGAVSTTQVQSLIDQLQRVVPSGVHVWAVKPSTFNAARGFISMAMVLGEPAPGETLTSIESGFASRVAILGDAVTNLRHSQVRVASGNAVWFGYTQRAALSNGTFVTFSANTYVVLKDGYGYVVVFASLKPATSAEVREYALIVGSIASSQ